MRAPPSTVPPLGRVLGDPVGPDGRRAPEAMAGRAGSGGTESSGLKQGLRFFHGQFQQPLLLSKPPGHTTQATWGPKELMTLQTNTQWVVEKLRP